MAELDTTHWHQSEDINILNNSCRIKKLGIFLNVSTLRTEVYTLSQLGKQSWVRWSGRLYTSSLRAQNYEGKRIFMITIMCMHMGVSWDMFWGGWILKKVPFLIFHSKFFGMGARPFWGGQGPPDYSYTQKIFIYILTYRLLIYQLLSFYNL